MFGTFLGMRERSLTPPRQWAKPGEGWRSVAGVLVGEIEGRVGGDAVRSEVGLSARSFSLIIRIVNLHEREAVSF